MKNPLKRWDVAITLVFFLLTIPAERFEVFSLLEDQTISYRHIFRTVFGDPELTKLREEIMIVALDESLYEEYGSFPFRRTDLGKIAEVLSGFGARVVGLDFLMDFKSSYGEDEPTAEMLKKAENVLLVSYANFEGDKFTGLSYPTEVLNETSVTGYTNLQPTSAIVDNLARLRIHKDITNNRDGWPYAVQALALYWDVKPRLDGDTMILGDVEVPLDQFGDIYIDFPALDAGTQYLSQGEAGFPALDILELENVSEEDRREWEYVFGDKIVLVGDTWEVTHDKFNTPMGSVYGVEIIANAISTLMNGAPLRPASMWVESVATAIFLVLLLATGAISSLGGRMLAAIGIYFLYVLAAGAAYIYMGVVVSMVYALLAGFACLVIMSIRLFMLSERSQVMSAADSAESITASAPS